MKKNPSQPIRVLVVDDHIMVRLGLATFLKFFDDLEFVGEAENGSSGLKMCAQLVPDVILMDMVMPDMDGVTAIKAIHKQFPQVHIIALSSFKNEELVVNAMQAGAIGYLLKDISADDLADAIRSAHSGKITLAPEANQAMIHAITHPQPPDPDLTERERDVLALMIEGLNNSQIAERLFVSPSTIKSHVSNILTKMGVTTRTEAVAQAVRKDVVS
jgi:NarL family two-component system response regulator LiaR